MDARGRWKVTLSTPVGPQVILLQIDSLGERFVGRIDGPMGRNDISGSASGNALRWVMDVKKPIPVKVTFDATVEGDHISGFAKAGIFGKAPLKGERLREGSDSGVATPPVGPVNADSVDPLLAKPYIEIDEQRQQPSPHRYVHGGFVGTDARFSFYFPPRERYQGRFFHNTYPLARSADVGPFPIAFEVATGDLGFCFDSGAYYVQTNLGGTDGQPPADPTIAAYRVNAAAAKYSRVVAADLYGDHRPFGYLFGGSGGSYQTIGAAENTDGVWDGFVAFVIATPNAIPSMFTVRMHALRILRQRDRLRGIADAIDVGGTGDPYAELDAQERHALQEATRMGFPLRGWWAHRTMDSGYFSKVAGMVPMLDPNYLSDFWSKPGYLGNDSAASLHPARFQFDTRIVSVTDGLQKRVELASLPEGSVADAHLVLLEGPLAGRSVPISEVFGKTVQLSISADPSVTAGLRDGDCVRIDNAWALALQTYQRHQVPAEDMAGWRQYRAEDGKPLYPQRELLVGPVGAAATAGSVPDGSVHGKILVLQCLYDIDAMPWQADWYRSQVKAKLGGRFEDSFALWFIDHAQHDNPQDAFARTHVVSYSGALQQALRDVSAWVERGTKPAQTRYDMSEAQVVLPDSAAERGGIQPVVTLLVNGAQRAEVARKEPVRLTARIEVPPGAGAVVAVAWDIEGHGEFSPEEVIAQPSSTLELTRTLVYEQPGIYFVVVRAVSQRHGNTETAYGRVENLARARIVCGS